LEWLGSQFCVGDIAEEAKFERGREAKREGMMYQISYGLSGSRLVESTEHIGVAANRYCELASKSAPNIELIVEGMPLDPQSLLNAAQSLAKVKRQARS
jgi:hypothetical protein